MAAAPAAAAPPPLAAVLHGVRDLRVEAAPAPAPPPPGHVLVRMRAVGVCGSDVHYWTHGAIGPFVVKAPMVIGHESAGVVEAVGDGVASVAPGDAVALEPGVPCGGAGCDQCREGRYNLCPGMRFFATPPVHGSLATWVTHPAAFCHRLPAGVTLEEGALCEPLAVGVHACRRGGVAPGDRVLVTGAGPIGLVCMLVAKASGAAHVTVTDVNPARLAVAARLGADATVAVSGLDPAAAAAAVLAAAGGPAHVVIECCGFTSALKTGIAAARGGGAVVLVGMGSDEVALPLLEASVREVDLRPVFRYRGAYPTAIALLAAGKVDVKPLVTHRFPGLDAAGLAEGFETARTGKGDAIKVMFTL
jgi:L-iditol 2-dehydrogenase